jgi:cysteine synthase A
MYRRQHFFGLVGNTPLVRLTNIEDYFSLRLSIYAKLERANFTGSIKDRPALYMIEGLLREGKIKEGGYLVEATSGNLGISMSAISARLGFRAVVVMPKNASEGRKRMIRSLGAELVLAEGGMAEAVRLTQDVCLERGGMCLDQFNNPMNSLSHYATTGPEIYDALSGRVDYFVAGVGSGGTIGGGGRYLKEKNPHVKLVAVEPTESAFLSHGVSAEHRIEGIGAGFLPTILDKNAINRVITVDFEEADECVKLLARLEGLCVGISSGANLSACLKLCAGGEETVGANMVTVFPDGIEKYLTY